MSTPAQLMPPLEVSQSTFNVTIWVFVAVSGDDGLVIFPWILSLVTAALWQVTAKDMYYVFDVQSGLAVYYLTEYLKSLRDWLTTSFVAELFFYTSLLSIKLSFLFFFRRLGSGINHFRYIWWPVLVITVGSYLGAVGNINYKCLIGTIKQTTGVCQTEHELSFTAGTLKANAALDIITDLMSRFLSFQFHSELSMTDFVSLPLVMLLPTILLFTSSPRGSNKPQFNVSETYLRMMSRIRSSRKRQQAENETGWLDLTAVSQDDTNKFNSHSGTIVAGDDHNLDPDPEAGYESMVFHVNNPRGPILDPRGPGLTPAVRTRISTLTQNTFTGPENRIVERFEFEIK
ncbi:hypothetical protein E0Z10_g7142 [Xylaria hypoxylon]|uniref:Rhodopsin domain-containing protein n=1 Tax=Xylaria hypoxylon TaxID=37992 RepID=A0A4Z0YT26_9PEZI|nr:hypothetical protein E0Z10_g7142 [Xylaria hypoxylon]